MSVFNGEDRAGVVSNGQAMEAFRKEGAEQATCWGANSAQYRENQRGRAAIKACRNVHGSDDGSILLQLLLYMPDGLANAIRREVHAVTQESGRLRLLSECLAGDSCRC